MDHLQQIRAAFISDLITEGDFWRIMRKSTFIDLIKVDFFNYQKEFKNEFLISMINNAVKILLLPKLSEITLDRNLHTMLPKFNNESEIVIKYYDEILEKYTAPQSKDSSMGNWDLNNKIAYIKTLNELRIQIDTEKSAEDLIKIVYSLLK